MQPLGFSLHCPVVVILPSDPLPLRARQYWVAESHFASTGSSGQSKESPLVPLEPLEVLLLLLLVDPLLLAPLELVLLPLSSSEEHAVRRKIEARAIPDRAMPERTFVMGHHYTV